MKSVPKVSWVLVGCLLVTGCAQTRSISHSGYRKESAVRSYVPSDRGSDPGFAYKGELSEFDVLGIDRGEVASEAEIRRALDNSKRVSLHSGCSILLIQSGAIYPDGGMVKELSKHFTVVPFSGVPSIRKTSAGPVTESYDPESYSKSLRLAAARGGNALILCCWGILESDSEHLPTRTISWVPVVNWLIPDESRHMRIRLKMAIIDVRSGNWAVFSPEPLQDARLSTRPRRGAVDQKQVERLKQEAYAAGVRDLVRVYSDMGDRSL
jgi:hypothetical protein